LIDDVVGSATTNLGYLDKSIPIDPKDTTPFRMRSDGSYFRNKSHETQVAVSRTLPGSFWNTDNLSEKINYLQSVGGAECDFCKKTLHELAQLTAVNTLQRCNRCKRAFYCNKECQKKQWRAGHKQACREPGQIEAGDYVRLHGLERRPELNGFIVEVVQPAPNKEGRWQVKIPGEESRCFSVATKSIGTLRPVK